MQAIIIILIIVVFLVSGCITGNVVLDTEETNIILTPKEANTLIQDEDIVILDVRTEQEFLEGHIKDAINIDFYSSDFEDELDKLDKDKTYLVYCRSGNRSGKTIILMKELGFSKIYDIFGGINEWKSKNLPIEG